MLYDAGNSKLVLCNTLEGWNGEGVGVRFKRERTCICLWLIHIDLSQKPSLEYKVIILQLKIKKIKYIFNKDPL